MPPHEPNAELLLRGQLSELQRSYDLLLLQQQQQQQAAAPASEPSEPPPPPPTEDTASSSREDALRAEVAALEESLQSCRDDLAERQSRANQKAAQQDARSAGEAKG